MLLPGPRSPLIESVDVFLVALSNFTPTSSSTSSTSSASSCVYLAAEEKLDCVTSDLGEVKEVLNNLELAPNYLHVAGNTYSIVIRKAL